MLHPSIFNEAARSPQDATQRTHLFGSQFGTLFSPSVDALKCIYVPNKKFYVRLHYNAPTESQKFHFPTLTPFSTDYPLGISRRRVRCVASWGLLAASLKIDG